MSAVPATVPVRRVLPSKEALSARATSAAFAAAWAVSGRLPAAFTYRTFDALAKVLYAKQGDDVLLLRKNLSRVRPGLSEQALDALTRAALRSYMRYWAEAFRLPSLPASSIPLAFKMSGIEKVDRALESGGVILVCPHAGNWDLGGALAAQRYGSLMTVAERLEPESLFAQFVKHRSALGIDILPSGEPTAMDQLEARLLAGGVVALVGDRDISRRGVQVEFFGKPASFPAGPAALAARTGALLFPVSMWFDPSGPAGQVLDSVEVAGQDIPATVQRLADALAKGISAHPVDWHMMQTVWLEDLDPSRRS